MAHAKWPQIILVILWHATCTISAAISAAISAELNEIGSASLLNSILAVHTRILYSLKHYEFFSKKGTFFDLCCVTNKNYLKCVIQQT